MTALIRSEAVKVRATRRTMLTIVLALVALVAVGTAGAVDSAADNRTALDEDTVHDVLSGAAGASVFFALVLGILVVTWEYHHRTMTHTLLAAPRRERVLGAKAIVALTCGLVMAAVATALALAAALPAEPHQ